MLIPLLWACNPDKEQVAPSATTGVQNGTGGPAPTPVNEPVAAMYTVNAYYVPNYTALPPATATPGATVYFCVLAAGNIPSFGQAQILPDEADMVQVYIYGTTNAGATFSMTADRAALMDEGNCSLALAYSDPNNVQMPFYGFYAQSYRYVAWKVPPFMPAGTYQVVLAAYQNNGASPRYFTAARRLTAQGTLQVNATIGQPGTPLQYNTSPLPSAASPIFGLNWTGTQFPNVATLRTTIRNTATNRYYCLSPGSPWPNYVTTTCSGLSALWNASALVPNSGSQNVRYNSTALITGQSTAAIPAGYYQVYLDALDDSGNATNKYLTTAPTTPAMYLP